MDRKGFFISALRTRGNNGFSERSVVNMVIVLLTALVTILHSMYSVSFESGPSAFGALYYGFKYIPVMVAAGLGGAVPSMMSVLLIFLHKTVTNSSFSYLTFIYLLVAIVVDHLSRKRFFNKWYKILASSVILQLLTGVFWALILWLLAGKGLGRVTPLMIVCYFLTELVGSLSGSLIIFLHFRFLPTRNKLLLGNGKYYVDPAILSEDERYEVEGKSQIGSVVMKIIVFEAIILGVFAEIASNTLVPTMKYIKSTEVEQQVQSIDDNLDDIYITEYLEERVSERLKAESDFSSMGEEAYALTIGFRDPQFSVKLAMLISIIVIPLSVFVNRYAQWRIAEPIRNLSKAVSDIYNSNDIEIGVKVSDVHNLGINTGDEIEELYHAVDLTFYRLMEYIELVKSRQTIENQLQIEKSANEAKSRFLSNISHEIRTPINAVLGFDEMILRETKDENILGYAKDIQGSGKTLLALINDILDFSKIEAGKMEIIPVEYELGSAVNDLANMASMRAKDKNLEFVVNVNENIPHVLYGDEVRIKQCILNILTNAIKYTEEGKVILDIDYDEVERDVDDGPMDDIILLKVKVTDTGIGIKEEDMEKLAKAFERIDEKRNRTIEGTGLGISIVNSLLQMMDSTLHAESEYGKGSVFSFELEQRVVDSEPVGDFTEKYKKTTYSVHDYTESFHAPEGRILVVDDTKTNLTVVEGLLKQTQIQIDTATSGMDAISLVKKTKYDMIFLDHRMPEMDGIQTFHAMQELEDNINAETPVIALTANAISGSREMYYREGFANYMSKPVDPGKLEEMILNYLPADKVIRPGDADFVSNTEENNEKEREAMQELLKVNGIDMEFAVERCGSPSAAIEVMKDFRLAIEDRASHIENYEKDGDINNYTIYVHGLKSSARAIGATELSEKAEYLEKCGNENNKDEIHALTPELLELYRSYLGRLEVLVSENDENKEEIDVEELKNAYASMKEFIEASYFDSADDIMKMLEDYSIPAEFKDKHNEVKRLMAAVDRDGLLNIL